VIADLQEILSGNEDYMKKLAAVCVGVGLMFTVVGCGSDVKLTTEQNDLVAEYVAGVMLKYSYDNEWKYQKVRSAQASQDQAERSSKAAQLSGTAVQSASTGTTAAQTTAATTGSTDSTVVSTPGVGDALTSAKQILGLTSADVKYSGYKVVSQYPEGEYVLSVPANPSSKIIAVEFTITNNTGADIVANTASTQLTFKLSISGTTVSKSTTILKNDITAMKDVTIAAGQSYTACALFQVSDALADGASSATMSVSYQGTDLGSVSLQ
jgi:hypothetical protein